MGVALMAEGDLSRKLTSRLASSC